MWGPPLKLCTVNLAMLAVQAADYMSWQQRDSNDGSCPVTAPAAVCVHMHGCTCVCRWFPQSATSDAHSFGLPWVHCPDIQPKFQVAHRCR